MPTTNAPERFDQSLTPGMASMAGQQQEAFGKGEQAAGQAGADIAIDMQTRANAIRVIDAENNIQQHAIDLATNPQTGYLALKGKDAMDRPNGMALPEEYGQKLQDYIGQVSGTMGNPMQQQMLHERAAAIQTQFQQGVESHLLQQHTEYGMDTLNGSIAVTKQWAGLHPDDPQIQAEAMDKVAQANSAKTAFAPISALTTQANTKTDQADIASQSINASLQANDPKGAQDKFTTALNSGNLTPAAIAALHPQIMEKQESIGALTSVGGAMAQYQDQFAPSPRSRLNYAQMDKESGGKDFNADGTPTVSATGARYAMQVQPATAMNPGYGIEPAKSDTPEEYNRVGRQYMDALLKQYGSVDKALAAYNAGPGTVDKAVNAAKAAGTPNNWMDAMSQFQSVDNHQQTMDYVKKITDNFSSGTTNPQPPTKSEFVNAAIDKMNTDYPDLASRPTARAKVMEMAEKQFDVMQSSRTEQGEHFQAQAQQQLNQNGGTWTTVSQDVKDGLMSVAPDKVPALIKYADAIREGQNSTDYKVYSQLTTHPADMAAMSDAQWEQQRTNLSLANFETLTRQREAQINGSAKTSILNIDQDSFNQEMESHLHTLGLNPSALYNSSNDIAKVGQIQEYMRTQLLNAQSQQQTRFNPKQMSDFFNQQFSRPGAGETFHFFGANTPNNLINMTAADIPSDDKVVPNADPTKPATTQFSDKTILMKAFAAKGNPNPSDADLLKAYRLWKGRQ
jgi:soluble lytic murein transglycosylase